MAKAPQIPLTEVMKAIDKKDRGWYNKLSDEKKKAFSALPIRQFVVEEQILKVNDRKSYNQ